MGRPLGAKNKTSGEVKRLIDRVTKRGGGMVAVIAALHESAKGITVRETTRDGGEKIYMKPPDPYAARILMEYRFGKPVQAVEVSGEIDHNVTHRYDFSKLPDAELDSIVGALEKARLEEVAERTN